MHNLESQKSSVILFLVLGLVWSTYYYKGVSAAQWMRGDSVASLPHLTSQLCRLPTLVFSLVKACCSISHVKKKKKEFPLHNA